MISRITDVRLIRTPDSIFKYEVWFARRTWWGKSWKCEKFQHESEAQTFFELAKEAAANPIIKSFSIPLLNEKTISIQIMHNTPLTEPNKILEKKLKKAIEWMKQNGIRRAT